MISITYMSRNDNIVSNDLLTLYDFGDKKGFLYKNEFTIYKILERNFIENICETCILCYEIPMNAVSIESYPCVYNNNIYSIPYFNIILISELKKQPFQLPPRLSQLSPSVLYLPMRQQPQPDLQQQSSNNKKIPSSKSLKAPNGVNGKTTQAMQYEQSPLENHTLIQSQWRSLDQLMRVPSPSHVKLPHQVPQQEGRHSGPSMKHPPSLQVRQLQKKPV